MSNLNGQPLSEREREVFEQLAKWKLPTEIAKEMGLSIKTVQAYCGRIKAKLGLESLHQLICMAVSSRQHNDVGDALLQMQERTAQIEIRFMDSKGKVLRTTRYRASKSY